MPIEPTMIGSSEDDLLTGGIGTDVTVGLAGDDSISGQDGADEIYGDFIGENLLQDTGGTTSFDEFATRGWTVGQDAEGNTQMSQTVQTVAGAQYEVSFELAANYAVGSVSGTVEVIWNGEVVGRVDSSSGAFSNAVFNFKGTGGDGELTFRVLPANDLDGPAVNTDGPIFWYEKPIEIGGETVNVKAFAEGQAKIYQVMDGQLNVFDPETETYTPAGAQSGVVVNAIGFNQQDDLIYGIAVNNGVDARGVAVSQTDLVMYDAEGHAYRIGETPYRSWTGDFDDSGNLWVFESDFDRVTMIDVDQLDADGNPVSATFKFPADLITDKVWDVAYDIESKSFFGMVRPSAEGEAATLVQIDISSVAAGGEPSFNRIPVTATEIDGVMVDGVPSITFGAFVIDGDGNLYAGGNGGDHDMNDATASSGGIYRVEIDTDGTARLVLVSDAPKAYSNDGAVDPRAMDPFAEVDPSAVVLIRGPELYEVQDPSQSYDDLIDGGAGADIVNGGYGADEIIGSSSGDELNGEGGDDAIYGGLGPNSTSTIISFYDENGLRYDQFGNLLLADDDVINGGEGQDFLHGSAGHDQLDGGTGDDTLDGGSGHDTLVGGLGDDQMSGGRNDDVMSGGEGADTLRGGSGDDVLQGGDGNDRMLGGRDNDLMLGGVGDDFLEGGSGNDQIEGGTGDDYIKAGSGDDLVGAGEGRDYINAGAGNDIIDGGAGNDRIYLGAGDDVATGGSGSDRFVFRFEDLDGGTDTITDFTRDSEQRDRLDFRQLDLLAGGDVASWISTNVSVNSDGHVEIDLDGALLICQGTGGDFLTEVIDGFMF